MNASAFLDELVDTGIRLRRDGDDLVADVLPTADLSLHTDHIKMHRPELLQELLQRQIVAAVTVAPEHFNRAEYDRLWALWHAQDAKEKSRP